MKLNELCDLDKDECYYVRLYNDNLRVLICYESNDWWVGKPSDNWKVTDYNIVEIYPNEKD